MAESDFKARRDALASYVARKVSELQKRANVSSETKRGLAQLRRAAGTTPGATPETWEVEFGGFPEALTGKGTEPSAGEWAAHIALTLYATHQQSQSLPMHVPGKEYRLGKAIRLLEFKSQGVRDGSGQTGPGMPRRFASLLVADDPESLSHYGRQIVKQLRSCQIPLDYGELAGDLYGLMSSYHRDDVRMDWCRQFVRPLSSDSDGSNVDASADAE